MTEKEILEELEALGTAQNRKIYKRHGADETVYGVSFANLRKMHKRIKVDHALALKLWETGQLEARLIASMIADPKLTNEALLEAWANDLNSGMVAGEFVDLVSKTSFARAKMEQWSNTEGEWIGRAGWQLLAHLAMKDEGLSDDFFENYLQIIWQEIHTRKNMVRDAMNSALIAIGIRNSNLEKQALAVAANIGKVNVDHGETNCKTPDAAEYIRKTLNRRRQKNKKTAA
jgi:3-methyladenine DNA glycosylase AlkD